MAGLSRRLKNRASEEDKAGIADILDAIRTIYLVAPMSYRAWTADMLLGRRRNMGQSAGGRAFES
jgi:hypothetical protein